MEQVARGKQIRRAVLIGIGAIVVLGLVKFVQIRIAMAKGAYHPMPEAITSVTVKEEPWTPTIKAVGSLEAIQGAVLSAEEAGRVAQIKFETGAQVKSGDLMMQLDIGVELAQLHAAEANARLMELTYERSQKVMASNTMSQQAFDTAFAQLQESKANVEQLKATIARKSVIAPFDGRAGIRLVSEGQFVAQGTPLVPLYRLDTLLLNFAVPQQHIAQVKIDAEIEFTVDAFPNERFKAKVSALNPQVEMDSRNVRVQAQVKNPDERLRPGMFASIEISLPGSETVMMIPAMAVSYAPYGDSVFVVETQKGPDGTEFQGVRQQFVKLGGTRGDFVAVLSGLKAGETIASSGVFKLRPGAAVAIHNDLQPELSKSPKPADS